METKRVKVLAIDDNKDNLISLSALVREAFPSAKISTALNGQEGINIALREDPDVILLDIVMPGMDGFEVCRSIKANSQLSNIPVVFVTSLKDDRQSRITALDSGGEAFIGKPIDPSELTAQIRAMVKIKNANIEKISENERLLTLVADRTQLLNENYTGTLNLLEDLKNENEARKKSEEALRESEKRYRLLIETANEGIIVAQDLHLKYFNRAAIQMMGYPESELISTPFIDFIHPDDHELVFANHKELLEGKADNINYHARLVKKDKNILWAEINGVLIEWEGQPATMNFIADITERKIMEGRIILTSKILSVLNSTAPLYETIRMTVNLIRDMMGIDAIGIRLQKEGDYPYFYHLGFTDEFIKSENTITGVNPAGGICLDKDGNPHLRCICGMVLCGKTEEITDMFTKGGSFLSNNPKDVVSLAKSKDPLVKTVNNCVREGFHSFALIPIQANGQIVGLLQLNTRKKDGFSKELVHYFESTCEIIGVALTRKQSEEALEASHDLLVRLSEQVPGVIYQYKLYPDGRSCFPFSSSGMNDIYEYSPEEVKEDATPVFGRLHQDDLTHVSDLIFESARTLEIFNCEFRVNLPKQGIRWRLSHARPKRLEDGSTLWHGIIYDVTDRKRAEEAQKISEEKYKKMLNASPDGIVLIDLKGLIHEVSDFAIQLIGVQSRDYLEGKHFMRYIPIQERQNVFGIMKTTLENGFTPDTELIIRKDDGSVFTGEANATLITHPNGNPLAIMLIFRDITQRKTILASQIHADRMANLGEMAAGIAHEINQPLNNISMALDNILYESSRTESIDLESFKRRSVRIFDNITRMKNIIDHIRAFSRTDQNFIETSFNLNTSIVNAASIIEELFKQSGIALTLQLEEKLPDIIGTTFKFEQVIINLLINAKDAVLEMKSNHTKAYNMNVNIRSFRTNEKVIIEVEDNGIGIKNEHLNKITLPFFTTKEEGKGTGLGLSISYQIIKEMNGAIEINSKSLSGTIIRLIMEPVKGMAK